MRIMHGFTAGAVAAGLAYAAGALPPFVALAVAAWALAAVVRTPGPAEPIRRRRAAADEVERPQREDPPLLLFGPGGDYRRAVRRTAGDRTED